MIGPSPLRYQPRPVVVAVPKNYHAFKISPITSMVPGSVIAGTALRTPEFLKSLTGDLLWNALGEVLLSELAKENLRAVEASKKAEPEPPPTVTPEMLADFFKSAEPAVNYVTNVTIVPTAPAANLPPAVFVLPSSTATYRSQ